MNNETLSSAGMDILNCLHLTVLDIYFTSDS